MWGQEKRDIFSVFMSIECSTRVRGPAMDASRICVFYSEQALELEIGHKLL